MKMYLHLRDQQFYCLLRCVLYYRMTVQSIWDTRRYSASYQRRLFVCVLLGLSLNQLYQAHYHNCTTRVDESNPFPYSANIKYWYYYLCSPIDGVLVWLSVQMYSINCDYKKPRLRISKRWKWDQKWRYMHIKILLWLSIWKIIWHSFNISLIQNKMTLIQNKMTLIQNYHYYFILPRFRQQCPFQVCLWTCIN